MGGVSFSVLKLQRRPLLLQTLLQDSRFYDLLVRIDADLANEVRAERCPYCGHALHRGDYQRKPRGGPRLPPSKEMRFSFCCSARNCRKRVTPPSVRFLGRKVYFAGIVLLATALAQGAPPKRRARLTQLFGFVPRTLARWRAWWRDTFSESRIWRDARSRFVYPPSAMSLPRSLLEALSGRGLITIAGLKATLRFLCAFAASPGDSR